MPVKTPAFWYRDRNTPPPLQEMLLTPFSALYNAGRKIHQSAKGETKANIPVICIGNILAGGSGKTPAVLALQALIKGEALAQNPFFLTRGYGGTEKGPLLVESHHDAKSIGDEPLLLLQNGPVIVSQARPAGATLAQNSGADIILMDDGFQNPSLHKDISFLVIDGATGLGNKKLLPAGPLREPLESALARTDALILIGEDRHDTAALIPANIPVFRAYIAPRFEGEKALSYIGFAGLGRPEKFQHSLQSVGLKLLAFHAFADHHPYTDDEIETLLRQAKEKNATLITTEKDFVRIPEKFHAYIQTFPIALEWTDTHAIVSFLKEKLKTAP